MGCFILDDTEIVSMFERANNAFLNREMDLIRRRASERCICGRLMLAIHEELIQISADYYVDIERLQKPQTIKNVNFLSEVPLK